VQWSQIQFEFVFIERLDSALGVDKVVGIVVYCLVTVEILAFKVFDDEVLQLLLVEFNAGRATVGDSFRVAVQVQHVDSLDAVALQNEIQKVEPLALVEQVDRLEDLLAEERAELHDAFGAVHLQQEANQLLALPDALQPVHQFTQEGHTVVHLTFVHQLDIRILVLYQGNYFLTLPVSSQRSQWNELLKHGQVSFF